MADRDDKLPDNVPGRFYVDGQCIDCDLCRQTAPLNFERSEAEGYSYVIKQPETSDDASFITGQTISVSGGLTMAG